jgi:pyridoxine 4-dehydrogenase
VIDNGQVLRYDGPAQLRQGIEDNLRSLAVDHLAVVNLRLMDDERPDHRFEDQLAAMVKARDDGLIGGIGLSSVSLDHLRIRACDHRRCMRAEPDEPVGPALHANT